MAVAFMARRGLLIVLLTAALGASPSLAQTSPGFTGARGVVVEELPKDDSARSDFPQPIPPPSESEIRSFKARFPSGRDKVAVDVFEPAEKGSYPAVILLHGTHGPRRGESYYLAMANDLARHGYVALFVRYYDRGRKGRGTRSQWAESIKYALNYACTLPEVIPDRLGLVGYSQGAFLALNYAPSDPRLMAVVAFYGGLSPGFMPVAEENFPPTLLLHGTADRIVPVRRSLETFEVLRQAGKPVDMIIYPKVGHGFTLHERGGWDEVAGTDAWSRTISFLDFHLKYPAWTPELTAGPRPQPEASEIPPPQAAASIFPFEATKEKAESSTPSSIAAEEDATTSAASPSVPAAQTNGDKAPDESAAKLDDKTTAPHAEPQAQPVSPCTQSAFQPQEQPKCNPLALPPLITVPYLALPKSQEEREFVMVNPDPSEVRALAAKERVVSRRHRRSGSSVHHRSSAAKRSTAPKPKALQGKK